MRMKGKVKPWFFWIFIFNQSRPDNNDDHCPPSPCRQVPHLTSEVGVGRGNLTNPLGAFLNWVIQKKQDIEEPGEEKEDKNINDVTKSQKQSCCGTATWRP